MFTYLKGRAQMFFRLISRRNKGFFFCLRRQPLTLKIVVERGKQETRKIYWKILQDLHIFEAFFREILWTRMDVKFGAIYGVMQPQCRVLWILWNFKAYKFKTIVKTKKLEQCQAIDTFTFHTALRNARE